jgi:Na+-driven multidrug efflux pump
MTDRSAPAASTIAMQVDHRPTVRQMLSLWVPLAASMVIMVLEPSIVNIGLGHSADPELALGAYGVAYSVALLVEAPILMLIDASVARSFNRAAFAVVRRFTIFLGLVVTAVGLLVSATPLYGLIVEHLMGIPADVAAWARPTLVILSFWPFPIAWRRAYQGVLIRASRTSVITAATVARLAVLAVILFTGLAFWPVQAAVIAGLAMEISVIVEAALVTWAARPVLRAAQMGDHVATDPGGPLTLHSLWRFYGPLVATSLLRQGARPLLSAGIAAAAMARASLAAWPVAWGLATLIAGPGWSLQQLTTALASDASAFRRVSRFSLGLSLAFAAILASVAFTPLYGLVMGGIFNLSPDLLDLGRPALRAMALLPLVQGAQALFRGSLIRHGCTRAVRRATLANFIVLAVLLLAGVGLLPVTGVVLAATVSMLANLVELAWLWRENPRC